jgi:hypothetical protein
MINYDEHGNIESIDIRWTRDDILDRAQSLGHDNFPDHLADEVLDSLHHRHDCEHGINWTVIDTNIAMTVVNYVAGQEDMLKD